MMADLTSFSMLVLGGTLITGMVLWQLRSSQRRGIGHASFLSQGTGLPSYRASLPQIGKELARARRSNRAVSVIVLRLNEHIANERAAADRESKHWFSRLDFLFLGHVIRDALREIDIATHDGANKQYVIVLPETSGLQAEELVSRLKNIIGENVASQFTIGVAAFPADGLAIEDLVRHAAQSTDRTRAKIAVKAVTG